MKPETLFLLAGGAALVLYLMDKQQAPVSAVAAPPAPQAQPVQAPASPAPLPALPPVQTYQPAPAPAPIFNAAQAGRDIRRYTGEVLTPEVLPARDTTRVSTVPVGVAGLAIYGGWGK